MHARTQFTIHLIIGVKNLVDIKNTQNLIVQVFYWHYRLLQNRDLNSGLSYCLLAISAETEID
jgi:hypothetical protein